MKVKINTILVALLFLATNVFAQTDTSIFSFLMNKKIAGVQKIWKNSPNDYHFYYQYNDRGRGDSTVTHVQTNDKGLITSLKVNGNDYYKNPYAESFDIINDSAVWDVNGARKSAKNNNELYKGNSVPPATYEPLIKYLFTQPELRAKILPSGFMHLGKPIVKKIANSDLTLTLIPIYSEPTPLPFYIWLTNDMKFFAQIGFWSSIIKKGYENLSDQLFDIQENEDLPYFSKELSQNSKDLKGLMVFKNANIFQSATATVKNNMTIEVLNGNISSIYPSSNKINYNKNDTVIDCKGKFIMPGLWDMHGHYFKEEGASYLAGGVTHLRDLGNEKTLVTYKKQIEENKLLGPDISYLSLLLDKADSFQAPTGKIINTLQEGFNAIDEYKKLGYQQLKIYGAIDSTWVKPLADYAHKQKMKVAGHIPKLMLFNAEKCINLGYDEITHLHFIYFNFMGDSIFNLKSMERFKLVGANGGKLDLQSKKVQDFIALMKNKKVSIDPTLNILEGMLTEFKGDTSKYLKPIVSWLPDSWLPSLANQSPLGSETDKTAYTATFNNMLKMIKLLYDNGILIVAGTDGGAANALHHELELYVQAGIPANEVLKIATYNAALDCNLQTKYGQIKVGQPADFIVIDGNPIKNISDIRRVETVLKNKRLYKPKQLLASQGWKYYY